MAASLLFKHRKLLLVLPRQYGGKTELGCRLGVDFIDTGPGDAGAWLYLAKDHNSAKKASREKFARLCDKQKFAVNTEQIYVKKKPSRTLYLGSVDKDPDRQRGGTYGGFHWSEAAFSKIELGETIISVLQKVVLPTISLSNGYGLVETTLNGKNQFYELWENYKDFGFHRFLLGLGDMVELGLITRETYDREKSTYHPDVFRQEFECEFVSFQGRVYPEFTERHINPDIPWPEAWQTMAFAIDWGFKPGATCVLFAYVRDGKMSVFDEHYAHEELPIQTAEAIFVRKRQYETARTAGVGDHDIARNAELISRGIDVALADKVNVMGARMQIKEALYFDRLEVHPRCKNLIRELESATWHVKKEGELDESQDSVGHFDCEATLRYLIRMLSQAEAEKPDDNPHDAMDAASARAHEMWRSRQ